tara:strand:+ start:88 stop:390 length:303 start_codon:yes stop_codon:yes gene_type:complete
MTGKNKEKFKIFYETISGGNYKILYQNFMAYPPEMKEGVIKAYYDSFEVYIKNEVTFDWSYSICNGMRQLNYGNGFKSRQEANTEAFKHADKLMNEQLNK